MSGSSAEPVLGRRRALQRVRLEDVARAALVSPSTVSLYLRRPEQVRPARARAIAAAVTSLGYVPNPLAGTLAAGRSRIVSVIVPSLRNAVFADTVSALQAALVPDGLALLVGATEYDPAQEEALVRAALSWAPAAIVVTGLDHGAGTRALLASAGRPVIEMWELGGAAIDRAVGFDHHAAGATAASWLREVGCRRPGFVGARLWQDSRASRRRDGFASVVGRNAPVFELPGPASVQAGEALLGQAMEADPAIDGLACSNDSVALGVLFACQRRGIAVPGRLRLIGFGDLAFSASTVPPLTTVRPNGARIGEEVARVVLGCLAGKAVQSVVDTGFGLVRRGT